MRYEGTFKFPPSVNHYLFVYRGRKIKSKKAREYEETAEIERIMFDTTNNSSETTYSVNLVFNLPDKRKRDIDNMLKVLLDVIVKKEIISDDSKIVHITASKRFLDGVKGTVNVKIIGD